jgi:hypothetical protein
MKDNSVAIYVYKKGANLNEDPALKTLYLGTKFDGSDDEARLLGENIVNLVDEYDGADLDMVVEFRPDPADQRTVKHGELR